MFHTLLQNPKLLWEAEISWPFGVNSSSFGELSFLALLEYSPLLAVLFSLL